MTTARPAPPPAIARAVAFLDAYVREHPRADVPSVFTAAERAGYSRHDVFEALRWASAEAVRAGHRPTRLVPSADVPADFAPGQVCRVTVVDLVCECCGVAGERWALVEHHDADGTLAFAHVPPEADELVQPGVRCYLGIVGDEATP